MNVIYKLTLRHMRLNRRRTIVSIMGIVLAVALMTIFPTAYYSLMDFAGREAMRTAGYYHVKIENYLYDDNEDVIDKLDANDYIIVKNIGDYQCSEHEDGNIHGEPYVPTGEEKSVIRLAAAPDEFYKMMTYKLVEGKYPENDREIMLDESAINAYIELGDKLIIEGIEYTVSGIFTKGDMDEEADEEIIVSSDPVEQGLISADTAYTRLTYETLNSDDVVSGYFSVDNPGAKIEKKVNELIGEFEEKEINEPTCWYYDGPKALYNYDVLECYGMSQDIETDAIWNSMLAIMELVIVGVATSVISNGFSISLSERSRYLGMLSSVGATKRQKRNSVYFEGFVTGIIAIPAGIIIGIGAVIPLFELIEEPLKRVVGTKEALTVVLNPEILLWAAGFSVVTILASVYVPAKRASMLTAIEAIRMNRDVKIPDKAVKPKRITRKLLGFEGELALKNLKRDNKKYISTAASMAISMILFMTIYSIIYYVSQEINMEVAIDNYECDMILSCSEKMNDPLAGKFEEISDKVIATGALEEYYRYSMLGIGGYDEDNFPTKKILNTDDICYSDDFLACMDKVYDEHEEDIYSALLVMNEEELKKYLQSVKIDYEEFVSDKDNVILFDEFTESVWSYGSEQIYTGHIYSESIKDIQYRFIRNKLEKYEDEQGETRTELVEIEHTDTKFKVYSSEKKIFGMDKSGNFIYILLTPQKAEEIIQIGLNLYGNYDYYKIFALNTAKHREISGIINDEIQNREEFFEEYYLEDYTQDIEDSKDVMYIVSLCVYGVILVIALICAVNIINTLSTSMALRRREFAMLKAVGMSEKTFKRMIIYESMFYGVKTLFYGLPISTVFVFMVRYPVEEVMEKKLGLPWTGYVISIAAVFIIVGITMLYSTSKIRKENIIDSLKNENI